jgi:shikimate kinase / 3-dehydroquinate synthase
VDAVDGSGGGAIVLVGFMGAGKTSGVRSLAAELECQPFDSDHELERELGESVESFFDREGEHAFRAREEEAVLSLLERADSAVIALGGGALQSERVREALRRHVVVHLEVDPEDAWRRASGKARPLARDAGRFRELYEQRRPLYDSVADAVLPPADRGAVVRALPAIHALRSAPPGTRLVWARAESGDYPVFVGRGLIASGFFFPAGGRRFVVSDETVAGVFELSTDAAIKAGEAAKNLTSAEWVLR